MEDRDETLEERFEREAREELSNTLKTIKEKKKDKFYDEIVSHWKI